MLPLLGALLLAPFQIGHATRAQIMAVLPPSLRAQDRPDPVGERRYARLLALAKRVNRPEVWKAQARDPDAATRARAAKVGRRLVVDLEGVLDGPLRMPTAPDPMDSFPKAAQIRSLSKLLSLMMVEAAGKGDRAECLRDGILGLRLSQRMMGAGGLPIDLLAEVAVCGIAERAVLDADGKDGLTLSGRAVILRLLPPLAGPMPEMSAALRREFYATRMPMLLAPIHGWEKVYASSKEFGEAFRNKKDRRAEDQPGRYDPIATAKLLGKVYEAAILDSQRPYGEQTNTASKIVESIGKGLPEPKGMTEVQIKRRAAAIPNGIGLAIASISVPVDFSQVGASRAARRNLVRAVLLLRHGQPANIPDPFGHGPLKIDAMRRLVWSVGENMKDDGGDIGKGWGTRSLDLGYRY